MKLKTKFQDENFELGEVVDANVFYSGNHREGFKVVAESKSSGLNSFYYSSIKDFTDQWEDAPEESKGSALDLMILTLTNFIENEPDGDLVDLEDCKQMLEKLKAWRRLKDKGFKITFVRDGGYVYLQADWGLLLGDFSDVELLFGGED